MVIHINTGKNIVTYRRPVMKSFKQYITELFDAPVKVKKIQTIGSHHHVYMFRVNNIPYHVHVHHMFSDKGKADVDFGDRTEKPEDSMTTTGKQGSSASAVFAGVHKALRMHQKENPHIDTYTFDASNEKSGDVNPARKKLYGAIVRRHGGKQFGNSFKIPAEALREEHEDDKPVRLKLRGGFNKAGNSDAFMDELHDTTSEHPFDSRARIFNNASLEVSRSGPSAVHLHDIRALSPGGGHEAIEHLKSLADKHGVSIEGGAKAYAQSSKYPMNSKQLAGWYKKRGFKVGDGDEYDGYDVSYKPKTVKESFDPEAVKIANSTSRNSGAVGAKAITPKYVQQIANKSHKILDFGSGKDAAHAKRLREHGLNVTAHEFGSNQNENHDKDALSRQYDHVYASNVLNVQSSKPMLAATLDQIHKATKKGGSFIGNFPMAPRKADDIDANHVEVELNKRFETVKRVGGTKKAPLFHAQNPK